ncbi:hypothetical protein [Phenylobacterium sp.]|jgi:hypothetical protein|uniref:hypothetical protein n=1 Tax=Phenylobacterium sp. TaxID=1871053 RepID=UPI002E336C43|nr:hypothetical protein [Phenylobacterium sp.]HEX2561891.1 hypothetical protein [Phenylobacterium sp.]
MPSARKNPKPEPPGQVIDFDEGVVQSCPPAMREELEAEIAMLTGAFASTDDPATLERMARSLTLTSGDDQGQRLHARRLASMLRLRARGVLPAKD